MPTPTCQPNSIVSGDSANFYLENQYYSPSDWTAQLVLGTDTPSVFPAITTDNKFNIIILPADSDDIEPGIYLQNAVFSNAGTGERKTVAQPYFIVFPNPLTAASPSWAKTTLALVETALTTLGQSPNSQVSVNGQTFTKQSISALLAFRDRLLAEIAYSDAQLGLPAAGQSKTIKTRFRY